jgi:hypothetical protein
MTEFSEKFIGFVDVLGFKRLATDAENGTGLSLAKLLSLLTHLGTGEERERIERDGGVWCPAAPRQQRNLDFRVTQISDCVVVSAEVSPAGAINLVAHCWRAAMELLHEGVLCRGYIKRGRIFHTDKHLLGTGYQDAYAAERNVTAFRRESDERGTPYIEVDPTLTNYIDSQSDDCVKKIFSRMVKRDGGIVALFPFQRISHQFIIGSGHEFNPERERRSNQNVRTAIQMLKERVWSFVDPNDPKAVQKARHYIVALDAQLSVCDKLDDFLTKSESPAMMRKESNTT